ncbi:hypothetical protein VNO77_04804 [Canavalia gladiata]|uniref:Uncharacterized protein n=1 Tax=Canavalia gladiata TaxID=3824 RepID=A0AAN9MX63_CANGL
MMANSWGDKSGHGWSQAHSIGGLATSHAMEHFLHYITVAVFVTALMLGPTLNITTPNQELFPSLSLSFSQPLSTLPSFFSTSFLFLFN